MEKKLRKIMMHVSEYSISSKLQYRLKIGWDSAIFLYFILNYQLNLGILKFDLNLNFPKKCII